MTSNTTTANGDHHNRRPLPPHHRPNHNHYPPPYSSPSSSASFKGCCCCLFLLLSFLALLVLAVILVIVLAVKPKKPQFSLEQVSVQYLGVSPNPAAADSATVSLNIRLLFTAENDNKVGIKYSQSRFTVMYRGIPLGRGTVPGFYQPAHSVKQVATTVAVDRVNLLQADATDLVRDASLNDRVELRILGDVGAKIRILSFTSPNVEGGAGFHRDLWVTYSFVGNNPSENREGRIDLEEVSVDCAIVISPRKQSLTYKQCGFDGLSV